MVEVQCTLAKRVVPRALKAALGDALRVHTNFRIRPVIVRGMFQAAVCDVKNPPLFKEDGRVRHMGTAETKGLMLYATYSEKMITLHFFHGLSEIPGTSFIDWGHHYFDEFYLKDLRRLRRRFRR